MILKAYLIHCIDIQIARNEAVETAGNTVDGSVYILQVRIDSHCYIS